MRIAKISGIAEPAAIPAAFARDGIAYNKVENVNWPADYPYKPDFEFAIAHDGGNIYIHYKVSEKTSRAAAGDDFGKVWEDSCVEFFCAPDNSGYYNFELNCIGRLLLAFGPDRHARQKASAAAAASVKRWASIGSEPFAEKAAGSWEAALIIPVSAFFEHDIKSLDGLKARANFYKCGDLLETPHFISWAPVKTENPDFHRPEFFDEILFQ